MVRVWVPGCATGEEFMGWPQQLAIRCNFLRIAVF